VQQKSVCPTENTNYSSCSHVASDLCTVTRRLDNQAQCQKYAGAYGYACQTGSKCRRVIFMYRVSIFMSKLHYIDPKCNIYVQNCNMYIQIRRPVFVLYITVKCFYIFQYSFDINISRTFLDIYFMRSVFHVSLQDLSRISRA